MLDAGELKIGTGADLTIYSSSDDVIIKQQTQDKDIIIYANVGGVDTEIARIDGSTGGVGIGGVGSANKLRVYENSSSTDAQIVAEQDGTGDARIDLLITGAKRAGIYLDNSDSDKLKISPDNSNVALTLSTTQVDCGGAVNITAGKLTLDADNIAEYDAAPTFASDNQVVTKKYVDDNAGGGGAWTLVSSATASSSASVEFTGLGAYKIYKIMVVNATPANDGVNMLFTVSDDNGSSYKSSGYYGGLVNKTANNHIFTSDGSYLALNYTGAVIGNASEESYSSEIMLFDFSETSKHKKILADIVHDDSIGRPVGCTLSGGYGGGVAAINAVKFAFSSGNIASGDFYLYGLSTS